MVCYEWFFSPMKNGSCWPTSCVREQLAAITASVWMQLWILQLTEGALLSHNYVTHTDLQKQKVVIVFQSGRTNNWVITVLEYLIYLFLRFVPKQRNIFWFYKYQFWSTDEEDEKSSNSSANGHTRNINPSEFDYFHSAAISSSSFHWIRNVHCKEETFDSPHAKHVCSLDLFCTPTVFSWGRHGSVLSLFEHSFTHKGVKKKKKT